LAAVTGGFDMKSWHVGIGGGSIAAVLAAAFALLQGPFIRPTVTGAVNTLQPAVMGLAALIGLAARPAGTTNQPTPTELFSGEMVKYTRQIDQAIGTASANSLGLLFTGVTFPAAGRLLRQDESGRVHQCSGVLIDGRHFLTAAHCVCEYADSEYKSFTECAANNQPARFKTFVYFPTAGLYKTAGDPRVNPAYRRAAAPDGGILGDLAMVTLADAATVPPIPVHHGQRIDHYISVGFGLTSVRDEDAKKFQLPTGTYSEGIGTAAFRNVIDCTSQYADAICGHYSAKLPGPGGVNTAACRGDSGGPILGIAADGRATVIGIASSIDSEDRTCNPRYEALTMYTGLARHDAWLREAAPDPATAAAIKPRCNELLLVATAADSIAVDIPTSAPRTTVTINAAGIRGEEAPTIDVKGATPQACQPVLQQRDLTLCQGMDTSGIHGTVRGNGLAQISACEPG